LATEQKAKSRDYSTYCTRKAAARRELRVLMMLANKNISQMTAGVANGGRGGVSVRETVKVSGLFEKGTGIYAIFCVQRTR